MTFIIGRFSHLIDAATVTILLYSTVTVTGRSMYFALSVTVSYLAQNENSQDENKTVHSTLLCCHPIVCTMRLLQPTWCRLQHAIQSPGAVFTFAHDQRELVTASFWCGATAHSR